MRLFCFLIGLGVGLASLSSAEPARIAPRPLAAALYAMEGGRWDVAARLAGTRLLPALLPAQLHLVGIVPFGHLAILE